MESPTTTSTSSTPVYNVLLTNTDENPQLPQQQDVKIDSVVYSILSKFVQRADFGFKKYGTNLDRNDLSILDWIQHAQEEHMDAILYLEKLKKTYMQAETQKTSKSEEKTQEKPNISSNTDNLEKTAGYYSETHNLLNIAFC